jgi:5'(3')-deoxyribonucleotidase
LSDRRLRLGIDLDGVVADFTGGWIAAYNRDFGAALKPDQVVTWQAMVDLTHFATAGQFWAWASRVNAAHGGGSLFRRLEPYPQAVETLNSLAERHHVVIITTKPRWAVHDTYAWIADHRIPTREIHVIRDKWRVDCDVYLEDRIHTLEALVAHHPEATVCRYVRPWNAAVAGTVDVTSWPVFAELVTSLGG